MEPLVCDSCLRFVTARRTLALHFASLHPHFYSSAVRKRVPSRARTDLFCDDCGAPGRSAFQLHEHWRAKHCVLPKAPEGQRLLPCDDCAGCPGLERGRSRAALFDHWTLHHGPDQARATVKRRKKTQVPVVCDECGQSCTNTTVLRVHLRARHSEEKSKLRQKPSKPVCDDCGVPFSVRHALIKHIAKLNCPGLQ